jgi:5-methylcytosine-specific restriction endonuclease McrA
MVNIEVRGIQQTIHNLNMREVQINNMAIDATYKVMQRIEAKANEICYRDYRTWSHGHSTAPIEEMWKHGTVKYTRGYGLSAVLKNESDHACIVGSQNYVSISDNEQKRICSIKKGDVVLSKDGNRHSILATKSDMTVKDRPELVVFNTEKSYKKDGTILTNDHMVLAWNDDGYAYWEEIGNMKVGDFILRKIKQPWNKGTRMIKICKNCGEAFKVNGKRTLYCSSKCMHKDIKHDYSKGKHWKLSKETRQKMSRKNNHAYIDGRSKKPYGSGWTKVLKDKVKERDNYKCQNCGISDDLVVHHIDNDKHNNKINNLITLCRSCHTIRHWRERDCELVDVDLSKFKPVKIIKLRHVMANELFPQRNAKLYDLDVENENSFVVNGILVHNSSQEFGVHHPIYPKNAKKLHLGNNTFKEYVEGHEGKYFLTNAVNDSDEYFKIWIDYIKKVI